MDLTTSYLGLRLRNPLVASASPLSSTLDGIHRPHDAGEIKNHVAPVWSPLGATSGGGIRTLPLSLRGFVRWLYPPRMVKVESVTDFSQCSGVQAYAKYGLLTAGRAEVREDVGEAWRPGP